MTIIIYLSIKLVIVDQISKLLVVKLIDINNGIEVIKNFFYLTYTHNTGAAFSILTGQRLLLILIAVIILCLIFNYKYKLKFENKKKIAFMDNEKYTAEKRLEIIAEMIEQTKRNFNRHNFNPWIGWGVFTTLLGLIIYAIVQSTGVNQWYWLWFLEFAYAIYDGKRNEKEDANLKSHLDNAINGIWVALGWLYTLTPIAMTFMAIYLQHYYALNMIMPLVLIYTIVGVAFTGVIMQERWIVAIPIIGSLSPLYMFATISSQQFSNSQILMFTLTFFVVMVIPGLILNAKYKKK